MEEVSVTEFPASHPSRELKLSDELREQLGLERDDSVRLLHAEGRTLLLEKVEDRPGFAVPWDRDLVLSASVQAFPLADVLDLLYRSGKSGFLLFSSSDQEKSVFLHRGEVVFAASNQQADRLGECLFRGGIINYEQLCDAEKRWSPGCRIGKVMVECGTLTPRELWNGVKFQVEEIVRSLFAYTAGSVHFWEGEIQPDNVVRLSLPTQRLIAEGLRRRDELLRFLAALEDEQVCLEARGDSLKPLGGNARAFLDALGARGHFSAVCRAAGLDPLSGARTVQLLRLGGSIEVVRGESSQESSPASGEGIRDNRGTLRETIYAHVKLISELAAPLVATDGAGAFRERLGAVLADSTSGHPELWDGFETGPAGTIDPEELAHRVLRMSGDRERIVREGLGEVVAYLEFELRNHPRIDDPDIFLDALEDQRARLDL